MTARQFKWTYVGTLTTACMLFLVSPVLSDGTRGAVACFAHLGGLISLFSDPPSDPVSFEVGLVITLLTIQFCAPLLGLIAAVFHRWLLVALLGATGVAATIGCPFVVSRHSLLPAAEAIHATLAYYTYGVGFWVASTAIAVMAFPLHRWLVRKVNGGGPEVVLPKVVRT